MCTLMFSTIESLFFVKVIRIMLSSRVLLPEPCLLHSLFFNAADNLGNPTNQLICSQSGEGHMDGPELESVTQQAASIGFLFGLCERACCRLAGSRQRSSRVRCESGWRRCFSVPHSMASKANNTSMMEKCESTRHHTFLFCLVVFHLRALRCTVRFQLRGNADPSRSPVPSYSLQLHGSPKREVSNRTRKSPSGRDDRPPCDSYKKGSCLKKDTHCDYRHPPSCVFHQRGQCRAGAKCPVVHPSKDDRLPISKRTPKGGTVKDSSAIEKQTKPEGNTLEKSKNDQENI